MKADVLIALAILGSTPLVVPAPAIGSDRVPEAARAACERGVRFLLGAQNRNGSWGDEPGAEGDVGNTSIAALALMGHGSTPTRGPHATALRRAVEWVNLKTRGFDEGPVAFRGVTLLQRKLGPNADLYLVSLFYSQLLGMNVDAVDDQRMHRELSGMCRSIASLQKSSGDWETSYEPMLTTVSAWLSLKQSSCAGIHIPDASPAKVVDYLRNQCLDAATGIFRDPHWGNNERFVTQAGALRVFHGMDLAGLPETQKARQVILRMRFDQDVGGRQGGEEFLGALFATQALFLDEDSDDFRQWYEKIAKALLACQNRDGSWTGHHCITGRVFCTACSVLSMLAPDRMLPMGER